MKFGYFMLGLCCVVVLRTHDHAKRDDCFMSDEKLVFRRLAKNQRKMTVSADENDREWTISTFSGKLPAARLDDLCPFLISIIMPLSHHFHHQEKPSKRSGMTMIDDDVHHQSSHTIIVVKISSNNISILFS